MSDAKRKVGVVGVYCREFLTRRMTFVHSHLRALQRFRPVVLTSRRLCADLFPWDGVVEAAAPSAVERTGSRIARRLFGTFPVAGRGAVATFSASLEEAGAALVHAHFGPGGLDMVPVARRLGVPLLVTFHGYDASQLLEMPAYRTALRGLFREATRILTVAETMRQRLIEAGCPEERVEVRHLGIDTESFRVADRSGRGGEPTVLQVCGLVQKKGVATALRAFAECAKDRPGIRFVLAGEGPLKAEILELAAALSLGDSFRYEGAVSSETVARLMAEADVFVHPSAVAADGDREGIPTVLMEAMATGLPALSTRHEGIPELVADGESGLLVPEGDVAALAAAMDRLADSGETRIALGAAGARRVREQFDLARRTAELEDLYTELIGARAT